MILTHADAREIAGLLHGEGSQVPRKRGGHTTLEPVMQGRAVSQSMAVLLNADEPDQRPPAICHACYSQWRSDDSQSHVIACTHHGAIAVLMPLAIQVAPGRYIGRLIWHVCASLQGICATCWQRSLWALLLPTGPTSVHCRHNGTRLVLTAAGWKRSPPRVDA